VDSFELREEMDHGGSKYFLQTSLLPQKEVIQSSFFKNGTLFDTVTRGIDASSDPDDLRTLTKNIHLHSKEKFQLLLRAREKVKNSNDPLPHSKLAQALFVRNLYAEAAHEARLAIEKGNKESQPFVVLGESLRQMGEHEKAFEAILKGIAINPEYPDMHNLLGKIYLSRKQCREAIECFKRAIALNIYYGEPYLNLVKSYLLNTIVKEDYELSKDLDTKFSQNIERASQLNPFLHGEALDRAKRLFREKRYEETLEALGEIRGNTRREGIDDIVLDLYLMLINGGEELSEEAIENYMKRVRGIIEQNPSFADGYNSLGILYTAKCKILMDMASEAFRKALEININYKKAQKNLRLTENDRQGIFILLKALLD
jgi:tetratricopeptide (TPR) repeat protein